MRFPPTLALFSALLLLSLSGCGEFLEPGDGPPPPPLVQKNVFDQELKRTRGEIASLGKSLRGLRRGLANQERRLERARREAQSLTDRLEKGRGEQGASLKKIEGLLGNLRGRIDSLENEVAFLRASGLRAGAAPAPKEEPAPEQPAGVPAQGEGAAVSEAGAPSASSEAAAGTPPPEAPSAGETPGETASIAPAGAPSEDAPPPPPKEKGPEDEYNEALRVLREEKSFPKARLLFRRFISKYAKNDLADDAQYWIGESFYEEKNFERAILSFNKVQVDYANGDKAPDALLKEALSFLRLGDKASARELLGRVAQKYPLSEAAKTALEHLKSL